MATFGRAGITVAGLAIALRMAPATIRRHFVDPDCILAEILRRHLHAIAETLGNVGWHTPNRPAARRAAYAAHTRTDGVTTQRHQLLLRHRHTLPPDLAEPLEHLREQIGQMLDPANPAVALVLLDTPEVQPAQVEAMLGAVVIPKPGPPARKEDSSPFLKKRTKKLLPRLGPVVI